MNRQKKNTKLQVLELNRLMAEAKRLKKQMDNTTSVKNSPHGYFLIETELKECLEQIRRMDFLDLSKQNLIEYLCLCSAHRPIEPWQLLVTLSNRRDARAEALLADEALRGE